MALTTQVVWSKYVPIGNGFEVGIHRIDVKGSVSGSTQTSDAITVDVKTLAPGTIIGSSLNLSHQTANASASNSGGNSRNSISVSVFLFAGLSSDTWYICTLHLSSTNSSFRLAFQ